MTLVVGETFVVMTDRPVLERAFNAFLAVAGGVTAWFCLRVYRPGGDWGDLALALFVPFLAVFSAAVLWRALTLPTTTCRVDGARRIVELTRRAPFAPRQGRWRFDDIAEFRADVQPGHGSSWWAMAILRDGRRVALTPRTDIDREDIDRFVLEAQRLISTA